MRAVCVNESGKLDVKHIPRPEPKDGQLLIRVAATALNRADLLQVDYKILPVFVLDKLNPTDGSF